MSTPARAAATAPAAPSFAQSTWLVAEREIGSKLRSKSFLISFGILFAIALVGVLWAGIAAGGGNEGTPVAVTPDAQPLLPTTAGLDITEVADRAAAEDLVAAGDVEAAILADPSSPTGFVVVGQSGVSSSLQLSLSIAPPVELLDPSSAWNILGYVVAIAFGGIFFFAAQTFGSTIAQSVVEEKQTRVVELLISAIPTRALLAGKVIGNTMLAMGQILVLAAIVVVGLTVTGQTDLLRGIGTPIAWFAVFFLFGFVLLAALFAAAAAMVSRMEDIGSTTAPLILIVMAPYFLVVFLWNNPVVLTVMSYVPFSAPVGMPVRLFLGQAQWWEPLVSLVILLVTCVAAILVGAKIYQNSLLRMGGRVKFGEALRG